MSSGSQPPIDKYVALAVNPQTTNMSLWQSTPKRQICRSGTERVKGLAEVINKLIFNNLHNPPPTKYFDIIINPLYSKQLFNLVLVEDCGGI